MSITRDNLNALMEIDHVIMVDPSGRVTEPRDVYAPEVYSDEGTEYVDRPWELLTGYTSQYGYRGPVMHPSEYVGGKLADHILSTPGYYVALVVYALDSDDEDTTDEPIGWAVAFREL